VFWEGQLVAAKDRRCGRYARFVRVMVLIAAQRIMASKDRGVAFFVVAGEAAVRGEPGGGALDGPSAGMAAKSALAGGFAHDVQGGV
jgi:hypothetical protein